MAYKVRSGALNVYRKNSLAKQKADVQRAMRNSDVLSLSEVKDNGLLEWARAHGYGVIAGAGDSAILYDKSKYDVQDHGSEKLNELEGQKAGMQTRYAAYALLVDKRTGDSFYQIAAHTTPPGVGGLRRRNRIRGQQYDALSELAKRLEGNGRTPVLVAGDLNFRHPNIKGLTNATRGGVMHTLATGAGATDSQRIRGLNSDHNAVVSDFALGRENSDVNVARGGGNGGGGNVPNGGKGGGKDGKGGDGGKGGKDNWNRHQMAHDYGFALAFMESNPELKKLFNQAVKQSWDTNKFIAKLRDTKWFKHHSANVRNAIMQQTSDPATYKANVKAMQATVRDTWGQMFGKDMMDLKQIHQWAETAHRMGWSEAQLIDRMTAGIKWGKLLSSNALGGKAAEYDSQMGALIQNYGLDLGKKWRANQLEKLMEGNDTITGIQHRVRDLAMHEYKAFADRIAGGETVMDIAEPYMQKMADLLELNPNDIALKDKMIQAALKQTGPKGQHAAMDLHTFEDFVRRDKRWQYTDNAREQVTAITADLLRSFGLIA